MGPWAASIAVHGQLVMFKKDTDSIITFDDPSFEFDGRDAVLEATIKIVKDRS